MNEMITLSQAKPEVQRKFMTGVYLRMTLALFISATVAYFASNSYAVLSFLFSNKGIPYLCPARGGIDFGGRAFGGDSQTFFVHSDGFLFALRRDERTFVLHDFYFVRSQFNLHNVFGERVDVRGNEHLRRENEKRFDQRGPLSFYGLDWNYRRGTCKYVLALERAGLDYKFDWSGTFHRHHSLRHSAAHANFDSR